LRDDALNARAHFEVRHLRGPSEKAPTPGAVGRPRDPIRKDGTFFFLSFSATTSLKQPGDDPARGGGRPQQPRFPVGQTMSYDVETWTRWRAEPQLGPVTPWSCEPTADIRNRTSSLRRHRASRGAEQLRKDFSFAGADRRFRATGSASSASRSRAGAGVDSLDPLCDGPCDREDEEARPGGNRRRHRRPPARHSHQRALPVPGDGQLHRRRPPPEGGVEFSLIDARGRAALTSGAATLPADPGPRGHLVARRPEARHRLTSRATEPRGPLDTRTCRSSSRTSGGSAPGDQARPAYQRQFWPDFVTTSATWAAPAQLHVPEDKDDLAAPGPVTT
jgi:hypothetical protein